MSAARAPSPISIWSPLPASCSSRLLSSLQTHRSLQSSRSGELGRRPRPSCRTTPARGVLFDAEVCRVSVSIHHGWPGTAPAIAAPGAGMTDDPDAGHLAHPVSLSVWPTIRSAGTIADRSLHLAACSSLSITLADLSVLGPLLGRKLLLGRREWRSLPEHRGGPGPSRKSCAGLPRWSRLPGPARAPCLVPRRPLRIGLHQPLSAGAGWLASGGCERASHPAGRVPLPDTDMAAARRQRRCCRSSASRLHH
jgi:hypothetical protein